MRLLVVTVLSLPALLAFGNARHTLTSVEVGRALLAQMNGSAAGHITKKVSCRTLAPAVQSGRLRYACIVTGSLASTRAVVTVTGTSWRVDWAPLQG